MTLRIAPTPAAVALPPAPLAPPAPLMSAPVAPVMARDHFTWQAPKPVAPLPQAQRNRGGWDDLGAMIVNYAFSFPLAGVGALIGVGLGNPVLGASLAVAGGSAIGLLVTGSELWFGTRPDANPPVRGSLITASLIPAGLTLAGAGVGALVAGSAAAVATGAVVAVGLPWVLLAGHLAWQRWKRSDPPAPPPEESIIPVDG